MNPVSVRILHPDPGPTAGPLTGWLATVRASLAERHVEGFRRAGASDVGIVSGPPDDTPFGERLSAIVERDRPSGLVVLGSGAIPLATGTDRRAFVQAAGSDGRVALANDRFSADIVAVSEPDALRDLDAVATDNALPRWLSDVAGFAVADLRRRWRLAVDLDSPLDVFLASGCDDAEEADARGIDLTTLSDRIDLIRQVADDATAELVLAGRTSARTLGWLERTTRSRTRALVEERGLRTAPPDQRRPASVLGMLLDRDGPASLGDHLARLGDAAIVDVRVLLAHRFGRGEASWPPPEDRYSADLLDPERIADPWLRALTASAVAAPIPILLGGHTLVGPGIRLVLRARR